MDIGCKVTCALIAYSLYLLNRPFLISKNLHFQKEAKSQNFSSKNYFICLRIKNHFHISSFLIIVSLVLKQRLGATPKWPIAIEWTKVLCILFCFQGFYSSLNYFLKKEFHVVFPRVQVCLSFNAHSIPCLCLSCIVKI